MTEHKLLYQMPLMLNSDNFVENNSPKWLLQGGQHVELSLQRAAALLLLQTVL